MSALRVLSKKQYSFVFDFFRSKISLESAQFVTILVCPTNKQTESPNPKQ